MDRSSDQGPGRELDRFQRVTALRRDVEQLLDDLDALLNRLRRERQGPASGESAGELGEDRQVGVQPDPLKATDAER